jgi:hypothetical protein
LFELLLLMRFVGELLIATEGKVHGSGGTT